MNRTSLLLLAVGALALATLLFVMSQTGEHNVSAGAPSSCPTGNDTFELGPVDSDDIPCWTVVSDMLLDGAGGWCNQAGTLAPQGSCPGTGVDATVVAPPQGLQAVMTNQNFPGSLVLYRCDVLASGPIEFSLYLNNQGSSFISDSTLNYFGNQQFRADLVTKAGIEGDPFTAAPADILMNIYQTQPGDSHVSGYDVVTADADAFVGQNVCLRFAVATYIDVLHAGVDDVLFSTLAKPTPTITLTPTVTATPTITPTKQPSPGDTDGDGCSDQRENELNMDFLNPWDFYNPSGDGFIRLDDILGVIEHYSPEGDPPYDALYDRSIGPGGLGPPDGKIDVPTDILSSILRYHIDCATPPPPGPTPPTSAGLAFSIGVDTDGDTTDDCATSGGTTTCQAPDVAFTLNLYLDSLPNGVSDYVGLNTHVTYTGLTSNDGDLTDWDACLPAVSILHELAGETAMACVSYLVPPAVNSTYTGLIGTLDFTCTGDGQISMVHGELDTALFEDAATFHIEANLSTETLTINCSVTPTITPTPSNTLTPTETPTPTLSPTPTNTPTPKNPDADTDGDTIPNSSDPNDDNDACTDAQENGPDETLGGRRNPHNPWDFYDVLGAGGGPPDKLIDLPNDILGVIQRFSPDGAAPYDVLFDRGPQIGANAWNMSAPDGVIDLPNDILGVIMQFNHDCR